ncbi:MAG TPA: FAD-dependent oxidoreductase, partial [Thermodesulfobacteriota bacterium]|nr:FAD-dependent oxidoreductase [Thermodesulfobacteriota bacterium]
MKEKTQDTGLDRRGFMKGAAAGAVGIAAAGLLPGRAEAEPLPAEKVKKWDDAADVLVIGSGFAALSAAIEAKNAGAKVLVIEKMPLPGGNSIINGGDFAAARSKFQKSEGIEDSPELMLKDMLKAGLYLNHVEKAKIVAEKSNEALEWTIDYLGAKYTTVGFHGGHSVKRAVHTVSGIGSEVVNKMLAKAKELGIPVQTRTKVVRFVMGKNGRIVGVEALKGYRFPDEKSGTRAYIKANRAVVLASGGFGRDLKLRLVHDPRLND